MNWIDLYKVWDMWNFTHCLALEPIPACDQDADSEESLLSSYGADTPGGIIWQLSPNSTLIFMVLGARAVISFCIRSAMPGYMVVPPERTLLA